LRAIVSHMQAYPKKLPVVLLATLATMLLSTGVIVTGALLRMTAPRAVAAFASPAVAAQTFEVVPAETVAEAASVIGPPLPEAAGDLHEIEELADTLCVAGDTARKVTILGTAAGESVTLTALKLARLLAREARVVVVDLAASSPMMSAISVDPAAPGLAELMQGEASFGQIITRDRLSRVHLVNAGRPGFDRASLRSPRLTLAIDALLQVYDHVLLDAGAASDLPAELLTAKAHAVVVPDAAMPRDDRMLMYDQLQAAGFGEVTMLSHPAQPSSAAEPAPSVAAA
jgi:polysaccharide biosynthesis transport protein